MPTGVLIDKLLVKDLCNQGFGVVEIARKLEVTKGAISRILKKLDIEVSKHIVKDVKKYIDKQDVISHNLQYLADKAKSELAFIDLEVPKENSPDYRLWQDQKLKFQAEMRKLINSLVDIQYKFFQVKEVKDIIAMILEEIGFESPECQRRIFDRLERKRNIRLPIDLT